MPSQLVTTKLYAPPHRSALVARPHLAERLDAGASRALTLLSAPAGFGKTTLVAEWSAARATPAAWLSLDEDDGELSRFLLHLVAALRTHDAGFGEAVLAALNAPQAPPTRWLLAELLNALDALEADLVLVLDDYHTVDSADVDAALGYLLERLPPKLHLVITTREDPDLKLAGLRARGELVELRAADLRFARDESAAFLREVMGLELAPEDLAALESRTEGWVAGLQLAALSMRGRDDVSGFIRAFAGDHRFVVDYLVEEVLQRQSDEVRDFLLATSVVDRLCAALGQALTGNREAGALLDTLERSNLFVTPLDDRRAWYRYHPLFADMLRARLGQQGPEPVAELHARASRWFEAEGEVAEAVDHALAAGDIERSARLIEGAWQAMDSAFRSSTWKAWVERLPEADIRSRPGLMVGHAWALLNAGEMEAAERRLQDADELFEAAGDDVELRPLAGTAASAGAYLALATGDPAASVAQARRALELLPPDDAVGRGVPLGLLSLAHWANGDLAEAYAVMADAMDGYLAAGNLVAGLSGTFALADILTSQGRLRQAARTLEDALVRVGAVDDVVPGTAELHVGLAETLRERGELEAAEAHLRSAEALGEPAVLPGDEARLRVAIARVEAGLGRRERALELLDEADRLRIRTPMPELRPGEAWRARWWLELGRLAEAQAWMRERGLPDPDDARYLREFEQLVAVRVRLAERRRVAEADLDDVLQTLERLLGGAREGDRRGSAIEILVLRALAQQAAGDPDAAAALAEALELAGPEGYLRTFVDEGPALRPVLREVVRRKLGGAYARRLLAASDPDGAAPPPLPDDVEPLTEREREVLRLLASELSGPEIARHLGVSLNTVRTHSKNVYGKLGVSSRRAAVRRAEELGLR